MRTMNLRRHEPARADRRLRRFVASPWWWLLVLACFLLPAALICFFLLRTPGIAPFEYPIF